MKLKNNSIIRSISGFTLIEISLTVAIVGILAVSASMYFIDFQKDGKKAVLESIGHAMKVSIDQIYSAALIAKKTDGLQSITINGSTVDLNNGYPRVIGSESFPALDARLKTWLNIETVDRNTANANRNASKLFTDKSTGANRLYIFFTSDYDNKSSINCYVSYVNNTTPIINVKTQDC